MSLTTIEVNSATPGFTITRGDASTVTLTVTPIKGFIGTMTLTPTVADASGNSSSNVAPSFQSPATGSVTFTDSNNAVAQTQALTLAVPSDANPSGTYTVTITATRGGATSTCTIAVSLNPVNWTAGTITGGITAPTTPKIVGPGASVTCTASATQTDTWNYGAGTASTNANNIDQYLWSCPMGSSFAFGPDANGNTAQPTSILGASQTWTAPTSAGEYTLTCAIANTLNASGTDTDHATAPVTGSREASATDTVDVYVPNVAIAAPAATHLPTRTSPGTPT